MNIPSRPQLVVIISAVLLLLSAFGSHITARGQSQSAPETTGTATVTPKTPHRAGITVDVQGEVHRPGVYTFNRDARVLDAIKRAGGSTSAADTTGINRAATVTDGQLIMVPPAGAATAGGSQQVSLPSINTAPAEDLTTIPGIGETTAALIVDDRMENGPYAAFSDLVRVSGIGDKTVETISEHATL